MNKVVGLLIISMFGYQNIHTMIGGAANLDQQVVIGATQGNLDQVQNAVAQGANVNAVILNTLPLMAAVVNRHYDIVKYLLAQGANVNVTNLIGNTPLHLAVALLAVDTVKLLLDNGADPTLRNNNGQTPADVLRQLPLNDQRSTKAQQIRQYFEEVVRPTPEEAQLIPETAT